MTRDLDWGVRVPVAGYDERDDKRIYVWIDAVVGYLSASVEWAAAHGRRRTRGASGGRARRAPLLLHGQGQHRLPLGDLAAQLLGYGEGGELGAGQGALELPYDVVSSEFLTMEGKQFSTSRNVVVHVGDFLDRYSADSLRYYLTAAGPETHDTDFTWAEFVRRNNDELVATWGNLVNRVLQSAYRNFRSVPTARGAEPVRRGGDRRRRGRLRHGRRRDRARPLQGGAGRGHGARGARQPVRQREAPWVALETDPRRAATILHVALRCIDDLKVLFTPFLPHSSQRLHELLGHDGWLAGPLEFREVVEPGGGLHVVLTGDYVSWTGRWEPGSLTPGQPLREPVPLFAKLDPAKVVASELERMERSAAA